jgi:hypothetical protein
VVVGEVPNRLAWVVQFDATLHQYLLNSLTAFTLYSGEYGLPLLPIYFDPFFTDLDRLPLTGLRKRITPTT